MKILQKIKITGALFVLALALFALKAYTVFASEWFASCQLLSSASSQSCNGKLGEACDLTKEVTCYKQSTWNSCKGFALNDCTPSDCDTTRATAKTISCNTIDVEGGLIKPC